MRTLGPGSVSSFLKIILDVAFVLLWATVVVISVLVLAALLLSFNPELLGHISVPVPRGDIGRSGPILALGLAAFDIYVAGVLVIVGRLRRIFSTLTAGDPFHPDNVRRLRVIGLLLAGLEIGRNLVTVASRVLNIGELENGGISLNVPAWFAILVVFVLAEVFREGARLRREAELTI
jgi:hypothetical protein